MVWIKYYGFKLFWAQEPTLNSGLDVIGLNLRKSCGGYLDELNDEDERVLEILLRNNNKIKR